MILNINQLISAVNSYTKINKEKFSIEITYKLSKLFKDILNEIEKYEIEVKQILLKYCEKDEQGNPIVNQTEYGNAVDIIPEFQTTCSEEINTLENNLIEIEDCFIDLKDFGNISVSIEELEGLLPFIKNDK